MELFAAPFVIAVRTQVISCDYQVILVESEVDVLRILQTADEQTGASQGNNGQCYLNKNQNVSQIQTSGRSERAATFFQFGDEIRIRRTQCGKQAKDQTAGDRNAKG